jgi:thiol-disulfide isomerase/thioredoxin
MNDKTGNKAASTNKDNTSFLGLTFIIAVVAVLGWLLMTITKPPFQNVLAIGTPAPVIKAEGWVNGNAPSAEELKGKVLLVVAWATWCMPCRLHAPELVQDYEKYKDNPDVKFIGLTTDDQAALKQIESFLRDTKITWLNGYGATETLNDFKAEYIPAEWVIDRTGKIVWRTGDGGTIVEAIDLALAKN